MKPAIPLLAALIAFGLSAGGKARAGEAEDNGTRPFGPRHPVVQRLVEMIEASPGACATLPSGHPQRRTIESDIARFRALVPQAHAVRFDVLDCYWDGLVERGERIVLSARLARATQAQRFFVIAHEFAHVALGHHAAIVDFVVGLLQAHAHDAEKVAWAIAEHAAAAPLSRRHEAEADAYATRLTIRAGLDIEQAARFFEQNALALRTHPAPSARADAIRAIAARTVAGEAFAAIEH